MTDIIKKLETIFNANFDYGNGEEIFSMCGSYKFVIDGYDTFATYKIHGNEHKFEYVLLPFDEIERDFTLVSNLVALVDYDTTFIPRFIKDNYGIELFIDKSEREYGMFVYENAYSTGSTIKKGERFTFVIYHDPVKERYSIHFNSFESGHNGLHVEGSSLEEALKKLIANLTEVREALKLDYDRIDGFINSCTFYT